MSTTAPAQPTSAPPRVQSTLPSTRVLHAMNPFVSAALRSPLHGLLDKEVLLLRCTGRASGKTYTLPVAYAREGDTLTIFTHAGWWKNLRGGAPASVLLEGRWQRAGTAEATDDPEAVLGALDALIARIGAKAAGRHVGLTLDVSPPPSREVVLEALKGGVVVRLKLED